MIPFSKFLFFLTNHSGGAKHGANLMFHRYQFGGCTWAHQSEQTCSAFFLWLGHAILNYPHYINCHIWGIIRGYTGVNRYTPPHFQTHPYHGSMGDPDPVEKRTRSASCDPWPRGWSRSKESASRVVWAQSLRGSGRRKTRSPMAKSTAWSACTQWKRTGWNVQRLGFETKHRHTEVTQPKKCNRHEVGFDSTGEYSPAPEEKCWLSKHVQNNWIHKGGVLLSNHWDPPSLRYSAVSVPRTALTAVWAKQETSKMLREHWLGIRSAFVCQHPFAPLPWWWLRLCYISLQQNAHSPICCRSWGVSIATSHHSHFAKTELGFQGSCHTKRMLPSPFFDPQSEWCRLSSKYLGEGSPNSSRWAFVASQELLFVLYCERQTFSWQFQNSLQRSRQLSPSSQDLQHSPTAKCWVALVYHSTGPAFGSNSAPLQGQRHYVAASGWQVDQTTVRKKTGSPRGWKQKHRETEWTMSSYAIFKFRISIKSLFFGPMSLSNT